MSDRIKEFEELNTKVLGVSTDSIFAHHAWSHMERAKGGIGPIEFPLLEDNALRVSSAYGVLLKDQGVALRGNFIISPTGIIRQITLNDLPIGRSVDETLRLIKAIQFTDINGEVCPANWTPGKSTIKPNPKQSLEFFSKCGNE